MEEIAATLTEVGQPGGFHKAAAEIYNRIASFKDAPETPFLEDVLIALRNTQAPKDTNSMHGSEIRIRPIEPSDEPEWLRLRNALWPAPDGETDEHEKEMEEIRADVQQPVFVAERPGGKLGGFIEISIHDQAPGCTTERIGYIEGWYVDPDLRNRGVGRKLVEAAEKWSRTKGCTEMASDTTSEYPNSLKAHTRLDYAEVQRNIYFKKDLLNNQSEG